VGDLALAIMSQGGFLSPVRKGAPAKRRVSLTVGWPFTLPEEAEPAMTTEERLKIEYPSDRMCPVCGGRLRIASADGSESVACIGGVGRRLHGCGFREFHVPPARRDRAFSCDGELQHPRRAR